MNAPHLPLPSHWHCVLAYVFRRLLHNLAHGTELHIAVDCIGVVGSTSFVVSRRNQSDSRSDGKYAELTAKVQSGEERGCCHKGSPVQEAECFHKKRKLVGMVWCTGRAIKGTKLVFYGKGKTG